MTLLFETRRTPLNSVRPSLIPRLRIGRVLADCLAGGERCLPAYIEVKWWQWRWFAWLGERSYRDKHRFDEGTAR